MRQYTPRAPAVRPSGTAWRAATFSRGAYSRLKRASRPRYNRRVRRYLIFTAGICLASALVVAAKSDRPAAADGLPNVVLITIDTLRADHLSSYGYHLKTSPRIDQLAEEGVRFENASTVIPLTGPSHSSLFTSRYPQEHGARTNGMAVPRKSKWLSLPQILNRFGYRNAAFVSAWPLIDRLTQMGHWFDVYDQRMTRKYDVFSSSRLARDVTPPVLQWLEENHDKTFFLWVHYFDPHSPYELQPRFASPESSGHSGKGAGARANEDREMAKRIKRYDSEIGYTDYYLGRVLDRIDRLGLRDSTLVVLTSDHGESLGEHGYVGHGRRLHEGILRVPLIMRYPKKVAAGTVIRQPVSLLDVAPTVLELAEVSKIATESVPSDFAGRSLAAALACGEGLPPRATRYVTFAGRKGIAPGWLSWMWSRKSALPLHLGKTQGDRKVVWTPETESVSITDLNDDPFENESSVHGPDDDTYEKETAELRRWFERTDLAQSEAQLTERDTEVLESLGYLQ